MPFLLGGDYVPSDKKEEAVPSNNKKRKVKVRVEKRKNSQVTLIDHLDLDHQSLKNFLSKLKKKFSCGGTLQNGQIILQGNFEKEVLSLLNL